MITGEVTFHNFLAHVRDGLAQPDNGGKPVGVKVLSFKDNASNVTVQFIFAPESFEKFQRMISGNKIVEITDLRIPPHGERSTRRG